MYHVRTEYKIFNGLICFANYNSLNFSLFYMRTETEKCFEILKQINNFQISISDSNPAITSKKKIILQDCLINEQIR